METLLQLLAEGLPLALPGRREPLALNEPDSLEELLSEGLALAEPLTLGDKLLEGLPLLLP